MDLRLLDFGPTGGRPLLVDTLLPSDDALISAARPAHAGCDRLVSSADPILWGDHGPSRGHRRRLDGRVDDGTPASRFGPRCGHIRALGWRARGAWGRDRRTRGELALLRRTETDDSVGRQHDSPDRNVPTSRRGRFAAFRG